MDQQQQYSSNKTPLGPDDTYRVIGTVRFQINMSSDITIWHDPKSTRTETSKYDVKDNKSPDMRIEMTATCQAISDVHTFYHMI
jgi:hypothetical protein